MSLELENNNLINVQEHYENILSSHWQKKHQLNELVSTSNGSQLRIKSINDRKKELLRIEKQKESMEILFEDDIFITDWYIERINEL